MFRMSHDNFTVDDLKDIVAGALSTVLSWATRNNDERPHGSCQQVIEEVPPLPALETRRKYITYMINTCSRR